ncbi:uncharacterized protein EAE97_009619 [Botrytis byssoidea]|uniref:NmrA-like domain-containing protein n=1 Tax=Botrytis byssoidea TaxID=139641 RepID=A0A9P5LLR4_9HELO|nr:uncharacterized protein EAE97_009619 [Botrytis byssoidea]KAF7928777.1 hypothetical protein EAE97_009619 [Botrytis byssoidea]
MTKIFIIGATGHIGGAVLDLVYPKYPDVHIKALVRDEKKGKILVGKYPRVTFVVGDLTSLDLLTGEAKEADVVINTGPDVKQDVAISAILEGSANHSSKAYYIHTVGSSLIWDSPGSSSQNEQKIFDDVLDIQALKSFPPAALHATSNAPSSPPPSSTASLPPLLSAITTTQSGFTISPTTNLQSHIHVLDLAQIYLSPLLRAQRRISRSSKMGPGSLLFRCIGRSFFRRIHVSKPPYKLVHDTQIKTLSFSEAVKVVGTLTAYLFGINMQVRCTRAKEVLGWVPWAKKVEEGLDEVLEVYYRERDDGAGMQELDDTYGL